MAQPPPTRQLTQSGPAGLLKCAISSAEQHIVHAPQDFPGAAVIKSLALGPVRRSPRASAFYHCSCAGRRRIGKSAFGRRRRRAPRDERESERDRAGGALMQPEREFLASKSK